MSDLDLTLAAIRAHGWRCVLLGPRLKRPVTPQWVTTTDVGRVAEWFARGDNVGLVTCEESGVLALDLDRKTPEQQAAVGRALLEVGPLPLTVETGGGGWHCYLRWMPGMPAKIPGGIGEVQRGPNQQVVLPPSVHPETGRLYKWCRDPCDPLPAMPDEWRCHLSLPGHIKRSAIGAPSEEPWGGPEPEEVVRRAMLQPGARRRAGRVKFQCPACRDLRGRDRHRDNAVVWDDGRWGCAYAPGDAEHRRAIGVALGVASRDLELAEREVDDSIAEKIMKDING